MASKTNRNSRKHRAKLKQKLRARNRRNASSLGTRGQQNHRIVQQQPRAWSGELAEDAAVFDKNARKKLAPETAEQAGAVRHALQLITAGRGQEAITSVTSISRSSPLSDWRLLIRGLVCWADGNIDEAKAAWSRLDTTRRPGRIAAALTAAHRTDLDTVKLDPATGEEKAEGPPRHEPKLDRLLLDAAKLVRRIRVDRPALTQARLGTSQRDEGPDLTLGPKKLLWLKDFSANFGQVERDLVVALQQAASLHAFAQSYVDIFEDVTRAFPGSAHDPKNSLLLYFFHSGLRGREREADRHLQNYLKRDLPNNREVSEPLRHALTSECYLQEARIEIALAARGPMGFFGQKADERALQSNLQKSIIAYPANKAAHQEYVNWLQSKIDDERLYKRDRQPFENALPDVMRAWSEAFPEDIEPRLWLVDYLLENELLDEAVPHVKWLEVSRHEDPRVRAAPWKWQLLEAMRLCRRKAWLKDVPAKLDTVDTLWPSWLAKDWLAYLRVALLLRSGEEAEAQRQRTVILESHELETGSLRDACMMLAAAQRMRIPAAELKPLRSEVDAAVENLAQIELKELIDVGGFFWDLSRTSLLYPAYRMHGSKFARELFNRLRAKPKIFADRGEDEAFLSSLLWLSSHRFFNDGYQLKVPPAMQLASTHVPKIAAAMVSVVLRLRGNWRIRNYQPQLDLIKAAGKSERDPFYRHWFNSLAEQAQELLASSQPTFGFGMPFGDIYDDDDDFGDEDAAGFDPTCDCADCRAARQAAGSIPD